MKNHQERINVLYEKDFQQQIDDLDWQPEMKEWDKWEEYCLQFMDKLHYNRLYHPPLLRRLTHRTANLHADAWGFSVKYPLKQAF